jgi:hypothetical protein
LKEKAMSKYVVVAAGLLVAMVLGATVLSDPIAQAAQTVSATIIGPLDGNGNVAVHEQGTVPAAQSGAWHVSVDGKPAVTSADVTTLAGSFVGSPAGGGAFTEAVDADVSHDRTVRVLTNCFSGAACGNIDVNVYSIVGSRSYLLDQFQMGNFLSQTHAWTRQGRDRAHRRTDPELAW